MYSVAWHQDAADEAQELFFTSEPTQRKRVSDSLGKIDAVLSESPLEVGESRAGSDRIAFVGCLAIQFTVDESKQVVEIYRVYLITRRRK